MRIDRSILSPLHSISNKSAEQNKTNIRPVTIFILGYLLIAIYPCWITAQTTEIDPLIIKGTFYLTTHQYKQADSCWNQIPSTSEFELERLFYPSLTIVAQYIDLERSVSGNEFLKLLQDVVTIAERRLKKNPNDFRAKFYLGYAYGFLAMYYHYENSLGIALDYGLKVISELEQCLSANPSFVEPYIAIGVYKYWRSSFTQILHIPFTTDERDAGIELIKKVFGSPLGDFLARNQLAWIYYDYKKYPELIAVAEEGLKKYPESRFFLWVLGEGFKNERQYDSALEIYSRIRKTFERDGYEKEDIYLKCILKTAGVYYLKEDYKPAQSLCDQILTSLPDKSLTSKQKRILKLTKELKKKCQDH